MGDLSSEMLQKMLENGLGIWQSPAALKAFLFYCALAVVGHFAVAVMAWYRGDTDCIMDRFRTDAKATVRAIVGNLVAILAMALAAGPSYFDTVAITKACVDGLCQGVALDAILNKAKRVVWTQPQREAAAQVTDAKAAVVTADAQATASGAPKT